MERRKETLATLHGSTLVTDSLILLALGILSFLPVGLLEVLGATLGGRSWGAGRPSVFSAIFLLVTA
jgi:hypothetical protein